MKYKINDAIVINNKEWLPYLSWREGTLTPLPSVERRNAPSVVFKSETLGHYENFLAWQKDFNRPIYRLDKPKNQLVQEETINFSINIFKMIYSKKIVFKTLALSGAFAGIVGSIAVLGIHHRFTDGMLVQPLYAWTGIIAALLVNLNLWFVPLAGFFFAAIYTGAAGMERIAQVPKEIATVIQAVIILN